MRMLNCTRETKISTILYIRKSPNKTPLRKPVPVTIEQIDAIPEIAEALVVFNDESLTKERRIDAMRFMSDTIQEFMYNYIYTKSNAVPLCEKFLGLPGYAEMDSIIKAQLESERVAS